MLAWQVRVLCVGVDAPDTLSVEQPVVVRMSRLISVASIEAMPEDYDTHIDENGVNLSGGQRQRLAIARALLKDSRVLMLDEATSALDNMTQAKIQQAMANIRGERTIITIAHRLSTVVHSDRIMVIENGRVLDQGTHRELLERCTTYRKLYEAELGKA